MQPVTIRIPDDTYRVLAEEADKNDRSMSEVVRARVEKGMNYDDLEARHDDVQRQLAAVNSREEDVTELVEYVEQERELQRRRENRQDAPIWHRAKWWVFAKSE